MGLNNFIPQIWSAQLLQELKKTQVFASLVNRDYEGEIRNFGDTVRINKYGPIAIKNYTKYTTNVVPDELNQIGAVNPTPPPANFDYYKQLVINQAKYFAFEIDDIDQAQTNPKLMASAMNEAAYGLADTVDQYIAGFYTAAGETVDAVTTAVTKDNIYAYLVDAGVKLDQNNVTRQGRWAVVTPWFYGLLLRSPEFVRATALGDNVVQNASVGSVAGFNIFVSNNIKTTGSGANTEHKILAGTSQAITMAEQLKTVEAYRPENQFSDAVKGLHLYGATVVRPEALVLINSKKG